MPDEAEQGFTVRDRRRFLTEEPEPTDAVQETPQATTAAPSAGPVTFTDEIEEEDAEGDEAYLQELPDIHSFLAMFLAELRNLAWLRMGLIANPGTGQVERDLKQAKVAIDTVAFLATKLEEVVPADERLPLRALVSDLQINYVEQTKKG